MTQFLAVLQQVTNSGFVILGIAAVIQWIRRRESSQAYLALALGSLGVLILYGQLSSAFRLHPLPPAIALALFMVSGIALVLFRDHFLPYGRYAIGTIGASVILTTAGTLVFSTGGDSLHPTPVARAMVIALVITWCFCVGEPALRFWLRSGQLPAVQRSRLRAFSIGYGLIVLLILFSTIAGAAANRPEVRLVTLAITLVTIPMLYVSFSPPAFVRRGWREQEEEAFRGSVQDLLLFTPDRRTLGEKALRWGLRLVGAQSGFISLGDSVLVNTGVPEARVTALRQLARPAGARIIEGRGQEGSAVIVGLPLEHGLGSMVLISGAMTPFFGDDESSRIEQYAASVAAALERVAATEQLQEASRLKSEFLANMSHELRTPLSAIIGFADLLADGVDGPLNAEQGEDVGQIQRSGRSLLQLINDILDLSKIEAGRMSINVEALDLHALVKELADEMRPLARERSLALVNALEGDDLRVLADAQRTRQVLRNLLSNAIKFTESGSVTVACQRESASDGEPRVRLTVTDTGIGISPEARKFIFEDFRQADSGIGRRYGGTGLGLAITQRLVTMQAGELGVESELGSGSTFWFTLPAIAAGPASVAHAEVTEPAASVAESDGMTSELILVVDDDAKARELIVRRLDEAGFATATAVGGVDALHQARSLRPEAITLDLLLPDLDGFAVLSALRADPVLREIPVVVVSVTDKRELALEFGAVDYVPKPFTREMLVASMHSAVSGIQNADILCVDDEPATLEMLRKQLLEAGLSPRLVSSGSSALEAIDERCPDAICVDLMMPNMSGFELIARIRSRADTRATPIIVLTAKQLTDEDRRVLDGDIERLVLKPAVAGGSLAATIRQTIQWKRRESAAAL